MTAINLTYNKSYPPLGGLLAASYLNSLKTNSCRINWSNDSVGNSGSQTAADVLREIARKATAANLYGASPLEKTQVDHWLCYASGSLTAKNSFQTALTHLNQVLAPTTFLVGNKISAADFAVFASLFLNKQWQSSISENTAPANVLRWYKFLQSQDYVRNVLNNTEILEILKNSIVEEIVDDAELTEGGRAREGKFVELPGAEMGKVVVRFPPEASGYLHIGHAKAALLNQYYQQAFKGKLILRFDDTNPAKEDTHFEQVILEDVEMLEIKPDRFTYTSDYFDLMLQYCEKMIKEGNAYVDDTEPEVMKKEREQRVESANRKNDVAQNLKMWEEMKSGSNYGQKCCVRAKIDMSSLNGCMRDPTIYRCKNEPHPRTGTKYKVYPTYDFACPIVDSIEGVTHTLRTMEYHDRDPQFYWFIEVLGLRKPYIWEYSRLQMTNTVLSKRKLTWFVEEGLVDGWDDPQMPTVRGVLRKGMTVKGLKEFIIAQGSSRSVVFMEWDKIWAFNKKVIDPVAPRYTSVDHKAHITVTVEGAKEECLSVPKHPKNPDVGTKSVWVGPKILIDKEDAECLKEGENATFINWGNLLIKKINKKEGQIVSVDAKLNLDNKDFKKTFKLTFLCDTPKAKLTPTFLVYFNNLISKPILGKDEVFKSYVGHQTRADFQALGDPELKSLKRGDIIQIQRKGFFRVDVAYGERSIYTCKEQPVILFYIPDGSAKDFNALIGKKDSKEVSPTKTSAKEQKTQQQPAKISNQVGSAEEIHNKIVAQGDKVRVLKSQKAEKSQIDVEVKALLSLKQEFKAVTGNDWTPSTNIKTTTVESKDDVNAVLEKISLQGDKVRQLKSNKADKNEIDAAVKVLLGLKENYKNLTGKAWTPGTVPAPKVESKSEALSGNDILLKIAAQGDKVRALKTEKAEKAKIDAEVKTLLELKKLFKDTTGKDWKPDMKPQQKEETKSDAPSENEILQKIAEQGDRVRTLKTEKAEKAKVDAEVKILLELKKQFKDATGKDWKPDMKPQQKEETKNEAPKGNDILQKIAAQGDKVRTLKTEKAEKAKIDAEVKILLDLKKQFKDVTGKDWKPDMKPETATESAVIKSGSGDNAAALTSKINEQGDLVRGLKAKKAEKNEIDSAVKILLDLKAEYKQLTGQDFPVAGRQAAAKPAKPSKEKKESKPKPVKEDKSTTNDSNVKKQTRLGLEAKKEEDLPNWYSQVLTKGELIEYYDVSGCYIYRPWSYAIWESIKDWFDAEIKKLGVQNCYFPIFVSKAMLEKEKSHIADFSPEVAWVTKSGDSEMSEPIAVRPTSETVMYPAYAKWIQSYRDLPIKLNQWNNVVRWEFKHPQPFLRTREFLWQEGHTAYATFEEAQEEVMTILDLYAKVYTDLLAVPVMKGRKTEKEKFAGGNYTYTVEAYISASGRAIQGATSHHLGQNFSKMFEITYEDPETQEKKFVYQNSWGITTRTIGVMIMIHSDNQGLVLPPNVASIQIIIVPCGITTTLDENGRKNLQKACDTLEADLKSVGIKVKGDYRTNYSPGWKFNHWELKGVPIRIELGPKDIEKNQLVAVRRDTGEKTTVPMKDAKNLLKNLLQEIHENLYLKALDSFNSHIVTFKDWSQFIPNLEKKNLNLVPFCGDPECEDKIKADSTKDDGGAGESGGPSSGAKSLCIPLEQPTSILASDKCIYPSCNKKPQFYTLFGRSY